MDNRIFDAFQCIKCLSDNVFARLRQNLYRNVIRDEIIVDKAAEELILCLRSCRETDFDFLKAHFDEHLVKFEFFIKAHRNDERLIAIAKVDAAPNRCSVRRVFFRPIQVDFRRHVVTFGILLIVHHKFTS